ncbi:hypothetical protein HDU79_002606 [Rhizoclosmatium sp. JEL0117]|nr:hypothetical protein HDU79_002606 [Rhizoclosmatium sp. JEL0117]
MSPQRTIGYYTSWSGYDIPASSLSKLTHLHYSFGSVSFSASTGTYFLDFADLYSDVTGNCVASTVKPPPTCTASDGSKKVALVPLIGATGNCPSSDCTAGNIKLQCNPAVSIDVFNCGRYAYVFGLKEKAPQLRLVLAVGGWENTATFWKAVLPQNVDAFVKSIVSFITAFGWDGIDIDWEQPEKSDTANFTSFLAKLRAAFVAYGPNRFNEQYIISFAAAQYTYQMDAIDKKGVCASVDYINLMNYDIDNAIGGIAGHKTPVFYNTPVALDLPGRSSSVDWMTKQYLTGCKPSQLNVGIVTYTHQWTKVSNTNNGLFQRATGEINTFGPVWKELVNQGVADSSMHFDSCALASYAYVDSTFYSLDDEKSVAAKNW